MAQRWLKILKKDNRECIENAEGEEKWVQEDKKIS